MKLQDLENIPALPNLDFKLRVGDSLLSILGKTKEKGEKLNLDLILKNKNPTSSLWRKPIN